MTDHLDLIDQVRRSHRAVIIGLVVGGVLVVAGVLIGVPHRPWIPGCGRTR